MRHLFKLLVIELLTVRHMHLAAIFKANGAAEQARQRQPRYQQMRATPSAPTNVRVNYPKRPILTK